MIDATRAENIVQQIKVEYGKALQETVNLIKQRREITAKIAEPITHWAVATELKVRLECIQELLDQSIIEYGVWRRIYDICAGAEDDNNG